MLVIPTIEFACNGIKIKQQAAQKRYVRVLEIAKQNGNGFFI
tara:strand:- start:1035 stop:1160 length:126 start_codon:yes stop_codon:yes gene_type:complete